MNSSSGKYIVYVLKNGRFHANISPNRLRIHGEATSVAGASTDEEYDRAENAKDEQQQQLK